MQFLTYIITTDTDYARLVHAIDMDSDGDMNLLSTSYNYLY